jgi:hypothetical protein
MRLQTGYVLIQAIPANLQMPDCGLVIDKDENFSINILLRFLARLAPHRLLEVCRVLGVTQDINTFTQVETTRI